MRIETIKSFILGTLGKVTVVGTADGRLIALEPPKDSRVITSRSDGAAFFLVPILGPDTDGPTRELEYEKVELDHYACGDQGIWIGYGERSRQWVVKTKL